MTAKIFFLSGLFTCALYGSLLAQNTYVYVSDAGNFSNPPWQILKFDENGENGEVFISDHLAWPQDIVFLEHNNTVLISNLNSGNITRFDATTGAFIDEFATGIGGPTRMEIGPDTLLYVLQWLGNGKVLRYELDGTFVDEFTATGVTNSIGLDWDSEGNLYVSSYNQGLVRKFGPDGADLDNFISTDLAGPTNIWFDENGDLLVADYNAASVKRFDSEGNYSGIFIPGVPQVEGIDFLPNGNLLIGSGGTSSVRVYGSAGNYIQDLVPPGTLDLLRPNAVVLRTTVVSTIVSNAAAYKAVTMVTPSVGERFQFSEAVATLFSSSLDVYDSLGKRVAQLNITNSTYWDASGLPGGTYFLVGTLQDGTPTRQQVVVQR